MATGLEAVGAASAVIQLIAFAGTVVSLTLQIYDGRPTPENELEEYAAKMSDTAKRVQNRAKQVPQMTLEERKLFQIAQDCVAAAEGLRREAQNITRGNQKGKVLKAVIGTIRANYHRKKIQDFDLSLKRCKGIMETELLQKICNKSDAVEQRQSQGFQKLDSDVQTLINQIASGNVKVEALLIQESETTRNIINTSLASEIKALDVRTVTEAQRQRLLKSLKSEEIRKRYNDVMSPSDACFERVFASYERVCSQDPKHKDWPEFDDASSLHVSERISEKELDEIDRSWDVFCSWLQSKDDIFWVQGKPGSGKSTLMKFIINDDNTKGLLDSWNQDAIILSHFFWKVGNESQNSIRGLLASLLHDILSIDNVAMDSVLRQFAFSQSKDFYNEWSTEEADEVLFSVLRTSSRLTCIFIDGLDEVSDKDGCRALMNIIERLQSCPKVKLCTSSRPDTELVLKFKAMRVPSLQLEDLTRPEMVVYMQNELDRFTGRISTSLMESFKCTLLRKAQGVFLWLYLATENLVNGIENGDDENLLLHRIQELPGELEDLYKAMWLRLNGNNRVYREIAARYFNCVIYGGWDQGITLDVGKPSWEPNNVPTLGHLSLVTRPGSQIALPSRPRVEDMKYIGPLCARTADDIETRCAGMLRISNQPFCLDVDKAVHFPPEISLLARPIEFIHRTAHDFLVDTESGQAILNYRIDAQALRDLHIDMSQSWLYLVGLYSQFDIGFVQNTRVLVRQCMRQEDEGASRSTILSILSAMQDLYGAGAVGFGRPFDKFDPPLELVFGCHFESFEETFLSHCFQPNTKDLLTTRLQGIAVQTIYKSNQGTPIKLIRKMIELGGDPHAIGTPPVVQGVHEKGPFITKQTTAFGLFLQTALSQCHSPGIQQPGKGLLDTIVTMAQTCQDWRQKVLIVYRRQLKSRWFTVLSFWSELWYLNHREICETVVFEVDMRFLLMKLIRALQDYGLSTYVDKLHGIVNSFTSAHVRIRHIRCRERNGERRSCHRVLAQRPFQDIIDSLHGPQNATKIISVFKVLSLMDSVSRPDVTMDASDSRLKLYEGSVINVPVAEELVSLIEEGFLLHKTSILGITPFTWNHVKLDIEEGDVDSTV